MGPYNMEAINNHRKSRHSGYMTPYRDGIRDPMASWAMHDDGGVAPKTNQNWTPKDKELTREISRQEDLGNMENAQELMDELNMKNRENGIDVEYYSPDKKNRQMSSWWQPNRDGTPFSSTRARVLTQRNVFGSRQMDVTKSTAQIGRRSTLGLTKLGCLLLPRFCYCFHILSFPPLSSHSFLPCFSAALPFSSSTKHT